VRWENQAARSQRAKIAAHTFYPDGQTLVQRRRTLGAS